MMKTSIVALMVTALASAAPHGGYPCPCCVEHTYAVPDGADPRDPCVEAIRVVAQVAIDEARQECIDEGGPLYGDWSDALQCCNDTYGYNTPWWSVAKWQYCRDLATWNLGQALAPINNAYEGEVVSITLWADYEIGQCP